MDYMLTDAQWALIASLLPGREGTKGGRRQDNRQVVKAVHWRALPAAWGNWNTTYTQFQRWTALGVWARVLAAV